MSKAAKFIFGAMLGAAAAALLTPVNGKTARSRLQKAAAKSGFASEAIKQGVANLARAARGLKSAAPRKTKSKT